MDFFKAIIIILIREVPREELQKSHDYSTAVAKAQIRSQKNKLKPLPIEL